MLIESESCEQCRFDSTAYTDEDVAGTLRTVGGWWRLATQGIDATTLQSRPTPETWSAVEYAHHTAAVTLLLGAALAVQTGANGIDFGPEPEPEAVAATPLVAEIGPLLDHIEAAADKFVAQLPEAASSPNIAQLGADTYPTSWITRHACHDALHHLQDVGRGLHLLGAGTPSQQALVTQINQGSGGVPKHAVDEARIGYRGIAGDKQRARVHHGRVWQALCLYSSEAINRLRAEGHPIEAGFAGENLTLAGIDWATLRPNTRIAIGNEVMLELTVPALPCKKNAQWFRGGDFMRMHHVEHPGETRWYARVLHDGVVRRGDAAVVEP